MNERPLFTGPQPVAYALSLKQPWAALLAHGHKTVEVRRWPTARLGKILIHAALVPDQRAEVWKLVPADIWGATQLRGGIVGAGELTGCVRYDAVEAFRADQHRHLNDPAWFSGRVLYGFTFTQLGPLPFRPYPGWMRFFAVKDEAPG